MDKGHRKERARAHRHTNRTKTGTERVVRLVSFGRNVCCFFTNQQLLQAGLLLLLRLFNSWVDRQRRKKEKRNDQDIGMCRCRCGPRRRGKPHFQRGHNVSSQYNRLEIDRERERQMERWLNRIQGHGRCHSTGRSGM